MKWIWVFNGAGSSIPNGVFTQRALAEKWIVENEVTGILTKYPLDMGVYDWAIMNKFFTPKREDQKNAHFKQTFTCASLEHYHYENGKCE